MMFARVLLLLALTVQLPPDQAYQDLVALQNRAMQPGPGAAMDHRRSITIAEQLKRPRLLAVLFQRLGRHLEPLNVQDAVIAYEAGLKALTSVQGLNAQEELDRITRVPKGFNVSSTAVPADLYSQPLANELASAENDPMLLVNLMIDIGNAYFQQPQLDVALDRYRSALARPEMAKAPRQRAYVLANTGEILRRQGAIEEAEKALRESLDLLRRDAPAIDARRALVLLAGIYRDRKDDAQALKTYNEALELYRQAQDGRGEGRAYGSLGRLHLQANRLPEALAAFGRAVELGEQARDSQSLWHAYWGLGQAQRGMGDRAGAATSLGKSLDLIESSQQNLSTDEGKVSFLDSAQEVFEQVITLHLDRATSEPVAYRDALGMAERARAGALREMMNTDERSRLFCPENQPVPQVMSPVAQMAPATRVLPWEMREPDPRCAKGRSVVSVNLPPLARLVFHVLNDRTAVFAVGRDGKVTGHIAALGRDALTARVAALREAMNVDAGGRGVTTEAGTAPKATVAYRPVAQALYRELVAPVAAALPQGELVALEPHGPLWLVPFAALEDEGGRPLIERWSLTYAPSAAIVEEIRREPAYVIPSDLKALIIGNPTPPNVTAATDDRFRGLRATFQPLPGAEEEARAIGGLLPAGQQTVLIGADATLSAVESLAPKHSLVHLASHALAFSSSPLDSFVMLAAGQGTNGQLTARRVPNLRVAADLVTLSACQTGMGLLSGDGVIGLSRAFLVGGARSVLVSQWSVSDKATAALMTSFYRRYLTGKTDKARALQEAMNEVRSTPGFEHPKFWAPFVLIGSER